MPQREAGKIRVRFDAVRDEQRRDRRVPFQQAALDQPRHQRCGHRLPARTDVPQILFGDRDARTLLALAETAERIDAACADPGQPDRGHLEPPQQDLAFAL